jgi:hypothetical protein
MEVGGQRHSLAALRSGKRPGTHCIGRGVCPRAVLDGCGKWTPLPPGFDPRNVQPLASRYTDCTISARLYFKYVNFKRSKFYCRYIRIR